MEDDDDNGDVVTVSQKMRDDLNESLHLAIYRMCQEYGTFAPRGPAAIVGDVVR